MIFEEITIHGDLERELRELEKENRDALEHDRNAVGDCGFLHRHDPCVADAVGDRTAQ